LLAWGEAFGDAGDNRATAVAVLQDGSIAMTGTFCDAAGATACAIELCRQQDGQACAALPNLSTPLSNRAQDREVFILKRLPEHL
jgi:hypothetical protein